MTQKKLVRIILVVEDIAETRDGIERLLQSDGYWIEAARNEADAISLALRTTPDLILVSLGGPHRAVIASARRIRLQSQLNDLVPIVIFCIAEIGEGDEVSIGQNVYLTRPDNFNQLRTLLARLLRQDRVPPVLAA
jgi:CheY-like chemotaxis protein